MGKFILKRFLLAIPVLFTILTLVFVLMRLVPGNPIYTLQEDANLSEEQMDFIYERFGACKTLDEIAEELLTTKQDELYSATVDQWVIDADAKVYMDRLD